MKRFDSLALSISIAFAVAASPASAQGMNDIRCVLASNAASQASKDPNQKRLAESTLYFYLGRIDGKYGSNQLAAAFNSQLKSLAGANVGPVMQSCLKYAQQRMIFIQDVGKKVKPAGR